MLRYIKGVFISRKMSSRTFIFGGYFVKNFSLKIGSVSLWHFPPEFHWPPLQPHQTYFKSLILFPVCRLSSDEGTTTFSSLNLKKEKKNYDFVIVIVIVFTQHKQTHDLYTINELEAE